MRFVLLLMLLLVLPASAQQRPGWGDFDGDCIDTRGEILIRDSLAPVRFAPDGCRVVAGLWADPYGGGWYTDASELEVDHIIPQSFARASREWIEADFIAFYNDPLNLISVSRRENQWKRAKGPAEYLPPNPWARCFFARAWLGTARRWALPLRVADREVLEGIRSTCE